MAAPSNYLLLDALMCAANHTGPSVKAALAPEPAAFAAFLAMLTSSVGLVRANLQAYLSQYDQFTVFLTTVRICTLLFRGLPRIHTMAAATVFSLMAWELFLRYDAVGPRETVYLGLSRDWTLAPAMGAVMWGAARAALETVGY